MTTACLLEIPQFLSENSASLALGAVALIFFIAFCIGVIKGFYRTSRRWIKFIAVLALFFFAYRKFADKIPVQNVPYVKTLGADIQGAVVSFAVFLAATVVLNIVFGVIDAIVKASAIKKMESGIDHPEKNANAWKPGFFSRLSGGVACMLNVGVFIGYFLVLAYFACSFIPALRENHLSSVYSLSFSEQLLSYLKTYALDSLAILFILSVSYCGYRAGALNGIRSIIITFGLLAAVGFGFFLPFSPWTTKPFFAPINAVSGWFETLFAKLPEKLLSRAPLFAKLATGLCLALIFCLLLIIINAVLKAITRSVRRAAIIRVIDGSLCFIVMFALAVAVVIAVAAVLYSLDYLNVFQGKFSFSSLYSESSPLNGALKSLFDARLSPYLEQAKEAMLAAGA